MSVECPSNSAKIEIGIEVGDELVGARAIELVKHQRRREREVILDAAAIALGLEQFGMRGLERRERQQFEPGEREAFERALGRVVQAEHGEQKAAIEPRERTIEREPAREIVDVEVGAVAARRRIQAGTVRVQLRTAAATARTRSISSSG